MQHKNSLFVFVINNIPLSGKDVHPPSFGNQTMSKFAGGFAMGMVDKTLYTYMLKARLHHLEIAK